MSKKESSPSPLGNDMAWSYHTFILPFFAQVKRGNDFLPATFVPENDNESLKEDDSFGKIILDQAWHPISWFSVGEEEPMDVPSKSMIESMVGMDNGGDEIAKLYNAFQYFTDPARDLGFGRSKKGTLPLVRHFDLRPGGKDEPLQGCKYVIEWKDYVYSLDLTRVRLVTYNSFVSILVMETEYKQGPHSLEDILRINEFGRHVNFPYLHKNLVRNDREKGNTSTHPVVADKIRITGLPGVEAEADFIFDKQPWTKELQFRHLMEPLKDLLSAWSSRQASSERSHVSDEASFLVNPVMDDRMFVCCLYRDSGYSDVLSTSRRTNEGYIESAENGHLGEEPDDDQDLEQRLYAFTFIDSRFASCRSRSMLRELLDSALYDRWIGWGTVHAVSDHSFVCLTSEDWDQTGAEVVKPFNNMYLEMVIMALAQKASILRMSSEAAQVAGEFANSQTSLAMVSSLQQRNALMQNQIVLSEVTTQEQGRDLYGMLRSQLGIEESNAELTDQVKYLYEMASAIAETKRVEDERKTSRRFNAIAVGFGVFAIISTIVDLVTLNCWPLSVISTVVGLGVTIWIIAQFCKS